MRAGIFLGAGLKMNQSDIKVCEVSIKGWWKSTQIEATPKIYVPSLPGENTRGIKLLGTSKDPCLCPCTCAGERKNMYTTCIYTLKVYIGKPTL